MTNETDLLRAVKPLEFADGCGNVRGSHWETLRAAIAAAIAAAEKREREAKPSEMHAIRTMAMAEGWTATGDVVEWIRGRLAARSWAERELDTLVALVDELEPTNGKWLWAGIESAIRKMHGKLASARADQNAVAVRELEALSEQFRQCSYGPFTNPSFRVEERLAALRQPPQPSATRPDVTVGVLRGQHIDHVVFNELEQPAPSPERAPDDLGTMRDAQGLSVRCRELRDRLVALAPQPAPSPEKPPQGDDAALREFIEWCDRDPRNTMSLRANRVCYELARRELARKGAV